MKPDLQAIKDRCDKALAEKVDYNPNPNDNFDLFLYEAIRDIPQMLKYIEQLEVENRRINKYVDELKSLGELADEVRLTCYECEVIVIDKYCHLCDWKEYCQKRKELVADK